MQISIKEKIDALLEEAGRNEPVNNDDLAIIKDDFYKEINKILKSILSRKISCKELGEIIYSHYFEFGLRLRTGYINDPEKISCLKRLKNVVKRTRLAIEKKTKEMSEEKDTPILILDKLMPDIPPYLLGKVQSEIRLLHYDLPRPCSLPRGITLNLEQASQFLEQKLNQSISQKNVLEYCLAHDFYAYIEKRHCFYDDKLNRFLSDEEMVGLGNMIDKSYKYPYEGLLRLAKGNQYEEGFGCGSSIHFIINNENIKIGFDPKSLRSILNKDENLEVQRSFSEFLFGYPAYVSIKRSGCPVLIEWKDLLFKEEELIQYVESYKSPEKNKNEKKKVENKRVLSEAIATIISRAKHNNVDFDKNNMPGTKKEFFGLLKHIEPALTKMIRAQATCNDYFSDLGLNFKSGNKTGKCKIFKKLCEIFKFSN